MYKTDKAKYEATARSWTQKYAMGQCTSSMKFSNYVDMKFALFNFSVMETCRLDLRGNAQRKQRWSFGLFALNLICETTDNY